MDCTLLSPQLAILPHETQHANVTSCGKSLEAIHPLLDRSIRSWFHLDRSPSHAVFTHGRCGLGMIWSDPAGSTCVFHLQIHALLSTSIIVALAPFVRCKQCSQEYLVESLDGKLEALALEDPVWIALADGL